MELKSSLDWSVTETELYSLAHRITNFERQREVKKIINNFRPMVSKLGQLELEARRSHSHSPRRVNEQLEKINTEIQSLEQWMTLLMLF